MGPGAPSKQDERDAADEQPRAADAECACRWRAERSRRARRAEQDGGHQNLAEPPVTDLV